MGKIYKQPKKENIIRQVINNHEIVYESLGLGNNSFVLSFKNF